MSTEIEIETEEQPSPEEEMAKKLEKKQKLETLYSTLKKLMSGQIKVEPGELEMMKKQTIKEIADSYEED